METPHPQKRTDRPRALRGTLPTLVVVGLVVLTLSSFLILRTPENSQAVNNASTPSVTFAQEAGAVAPSAIPVGSHLPTVVRLPTSALRGITSSPLQSAQAAKSAPTPFLLPTPALAGIAPSGATVIPYVPPTPYVTFTPGPGGRSAPGGIPVTPTAGPSPRPPATPFPITGKEPPACTFPLAQTTTTDSAPETYTFSDPKPAPLNSSWRELSLYQWLPDNQRLLVGHKEAVDEDDPNHDIPPQVIGLYNPRTGESQDFGSRIAPGSGARPPGWIPSLKAVVYPESIDLTPSTPREDGQGWLPRASADYQRRLWFSQGDPTHVRTLVDERVTVTNDRPSQFGRQFTVAASPDGSEIVYLDDVGKQLYKQKVVQGAFQTAPSPAFDATQWMYRPPTYQSWHMTWRPNSRQVFLYTTGHPAASVYTFLLDTQSGQVCELTLWEDDPKVWEKSQAVDVHWSPNGRYLAAARVRGSIPVESSDLTVLDTATGNLYRINSTQLSPDGLPKEGAHSVDDLAWAPDNRHLVAIGGVSYCTMNCIAYEIPSAAKLFLVDFLTGQSVQISSAEPGWRPDENLLWSSDGSQLIVPAPIGLYLFSVQKRVQP